MHKLYANNGENCIDDILAFHDTSNNYFVMNWIFIKEINTWQFGKIC